MGLSALERPLERRQSAALSPARTVVLALGNDILGDDAVGFHCVRLLRDRRAGRPGVDLVETGESGLAVLDLIEGYDRAVILDAVVTRQVPPGTILEFSKADFQRLRGSSPHVSGLPELLHVAERTGMKMPSVLAVLALEVETPDTFGETLTPGCQASLPGFVRRCEELLASWGH
ncbi:MAG: hydrogenase maturation protease [Elusimicrobia bacterium]|nr:hydrogenase maturation protease [Elusimicrobiota bacterium]